MSGGGAGRWSRCGCAGCGAACARLLNFEIRRDGRQIFIAWNGRDVGIELRLVLIRVFVGEYRVQVDGQFLHQRRCVFLNINR